MSLKTNIRSFRFSDEVAAILEQQQGSSLNDKFEQLVLECYYKLPEIKKQYQQYQKMVQAEREKLSKLSYELEPNLNVLFKLSLQAQRAMLDMQEGMKSVTQIAGAGVDQASQNV